MRGYYTPYIPGWDNHGMPIESAIIKQNKLEPQDHAHSGVPLRVPRFCAALYRRPDGPRFKRLGVVGRLGASV